ncbi:MAG TPA: hypothetical protein VD735_03665 [Candidatus Saccharimonadales bacterium]|nr:hypothetical protein [Candidatus Saccharimonadales bacterium]
MKRLLLAITCLPMFLLVAQVQPVMASPNTTLKTQIVAPDCTLDTIDNGSGPTQVITCPPEAVDLIVTPDGSIDIGNVSQPARNPGIRLQSPARAVELTDILDDPNIVSDLLEQKNRQGWDVFPRPYAGMSFVESIGIAFIVVSNALLLAGIIHYRRRIWALFKRKHRK